MMVLKIKYVGLEGKLVVMNGLMLADILCAGLNLASVCHLFTFTCTVLNCSHGLEKGLSEQECPTWIT